MTPSTRDALALLASVTSDRDVVDDCRRAGRGDVSALRRVAPILLRGGELITTSPPCPKCGGPCVAVDTVHLTR